MSASPIAPFEAPKLKIGRARRHLQELEADVSAYMGREPFKLIVEPWELNEAISLQMHAWTVRISEPVPLHFASILGDVIHNLRTSLDLMACDLVRLQGRSVKGVYFPFCNDASGLNEVIRQRNFNRAGPQAVDMVKALQPYRGGNAALRAIHDLDVLDKHQALVPLMGGGTSPEMLIRFFGNDPTKVPAIASKIDGDGQALVVMPPVSNLPLGTTLPAQWDLIFGPEADPFGGYNVVKTLQHFTNLVDGVVNLFAGRLSNQTAPSGD